MSRSIRRCMFFVGILWIGIGVLILVDSVLAAAGRSLLPHQLWIYLVMLPAVALHQVGLEGLFMESGGGMAWLTEWGVIGVYVLPGLVLVWISRRGHRAAR